MSVPGSANPLFLATAAAADAAAFQIDRSLRFNDGDSPSLSRNFSSAGNRKKWTWSGWFKVASTSQPGRLFSAGADATNRTNIFYYPRSNNLGIGFYSYVGGALVGQAGTTAVLADHSAWYHLVFAFDAANSTTADRLKIYINGVEQAISYTVNVSDIDHLVSNNIAHYVGRGADGYSFDGYLAEVHFVDGQALAATDFGDPDSNGVWQPKAFSGTYGTNGFYLKFADNSSNAALGTDSSGNSNTWTVNNITAAGGDHVYSSGISIPEGGGFFSGRPATNAFDGDTSTATLGANTSTSVRWTYSSSFGLSGAVEIYVSGASMTVTFDDGRTAVTAAADQYTQISSSVDFTWFNVYQGSGLRGNLAAVKVGGTVLIDSTGANNDSLIDTPTNYTAASGNNGGNYATFNPLNHNTHSAYYTLSNGNLKCDAVGGSSESSGSRGFCVSTLGMSSGKYYFELTVDLDDNNDHAVGIATAAGTGYYSTAGNWTYAASGNKFANSGSGASYGASYSNGDTIGVAFDADTGALVFYKNGTSQGTLATVTAGETYFFVWGIDAGTAQDYEVTANFGQRPFAYTPPTGYVSLCTENLSESAYASIADGSTAFAATLYDGDGTSSRNLTLPLAADLVWIKKRSAVTSHHLADTVRGDDAVLKSNSTDEEKNPQTEFSGGGISSISNTTVTIKEGTSNNDNQNALNATYVGWLWDAGTSTASNTDGSITSSVRANQSAGFSIVSWTGNGTSGSTVGHGLNAAPKMIIFKNRDTAGTNWRVYNTMVDGSLDWVYLNTTAAKSDSGLSLPTSTTFTAGGSADTNGNGDAMINYCFAPVEGYSSFGSYAGNGSSDGPFVYTGMRPKFILAKIVSGNADDWIIYDTARSSFNAADDELYPNKNSAEVSGSRPVDILSNGFKIRNTSNKWNGASGYEYVYAAFAEHPLRHARAR